jgi:hypothetical protein
MIKYIPEEYKKKELQYMDTFKLLNQLPPFLEIRLLGTKKKWPGASPTLRMIGSKIWLSYSVGGMDCVLYERAEDSEELQNAILSWKESIGSKEYLEVDSVFILGKLRNSEYFKTMW